MPSCSKRFVEFRRARPLLGTFVEIRVTSANATEAERAVCAAFTVIERVQALMSFHDPASEISRLNQFAAARAVRVDAWTYRVLRHAKKLHAVTGGLFDIATAPALVRHGWLPSGAAPLPAGDGSTADIALLAGHRVRFRRPLLIDLGGIAKGFAVDQAIAALRRHGATAGVVNAGGDLRVFGAASEAVHLRRPETPGEFHLLTDLKNSALASSAAYFAARRIDGQLCAPVIDPHTGQPSRESHSVTVRARTCCLADALCKVVWLAGATAAAPVLRHYRAHAWLLSSRQAPAQPNKSRHAA